MLYLLGAPCPLNGVIQKNHSLFMWGLAERTAPGKIPEKTSASEEKRTDGAAS